MVVSLISIPMTYCLDKAMIGHNMGIAGIGYASSIVLWVMFMALFCYSKNHPSLKPYTVFLALKLDIKKLFALFKLGVYSGLFFLLDMGLFLSAALMISYFGTDAMAAYQITSQCIAIAYCIPFSLSMTTSLLTSHALGANNPKQAQHVLQLCLFIGLSLAALLALLFIKAPYSLTHFFLPTGQLHRNAVNQLAESFLKIAGLLLCIDAIQTIFNGALKGMNDTFIPMVLCISCYWLVGVGGAYYLAFPAGLGESGVWYGLISGITCAACVLILRFIYLKQSREYA